MHDFSPLLFLFLSSFGNTCDVFSQSYPGCIYSSATGPCHARTERERERKRGEGGGEQTDIEIHTDEEVSERERGGEGDKQNRHTHR